MSEEVCRGNLLGVRINQVELQDAVDLVLTAAAERRALGVSALAVHGVMTAVGDSEYRYRLNALELVGPDGQPVRWGLNWLHRAGLRHRMYGPDLMYETCRAAAQRGLSIFLFGSSERTLEALSVRLRADFPELVIAGMQPSRFRPATEEERLADIETIQKSGAAIVYVGLGCPRQEIWVYENRNQLGVPVLAVGAAFDYWAGLLKRPPAWMQDRGLEWLYRFVQEPRRLWRRYALLNPAYVTLLTLQLLRILRFDPASAIEPRNPLRPS
ncbi:MAG: WecB/TagA/CpsF family glycosyltransferase [Geminicoccaceae bacterium]